MPKLLPNRLIRAGLLMAVLTGASPLMAETVLRYTPSAEPKTLDPVASSLLVVHQHAYMVYDTLFSLDAQMQPQPQMVGDFSRSEDGRTWTMTLREGLAFHDGAPVTTADVLASVDRWAKRDTIGLRLTALGMKLEAVDARTFTVTTDQPTNLVLQGFAKPSASALFIMRAADAATDPMTAVSEIVGSGPFIFSKDDYKPGAQAVYLKNTAYVPRTEPASYLAGGKVVNVDRVEWVIMPDATTAVSALQLGEIDIYESPPMDLLPLLEAQGGVTTRPLGPLGQQAWARFNFTQAPFDKPQARKAAQMLIDQTAVLSAIAGVDGTYWSECYSYFGCGGVNGTEEAMDWAKKPDVEAARSLLKESGYAGEPVVFIAPGDNEVLKTVATVVAAQLQAGGFNIDLQFSDFASMMQRRTNRGTPAEGGWNIFPMWSFTFELDNPVGNFFLNADCEKGYVGWYCNPEIQAAKDNWALASDEAAMKTAASQIQSLAADGGPVLLLGKFSSPMGFSDALKDFVDAPLPVFWSVSK